MPVCVHCAVAFKPRHIENSTFCSRSCSYAYRKANAHGPRPRSPRPPCVLPPLQCIQCFASFEPRVPTQLVCSAECRRIRSRSRALISVQRRSHVNRRARECADCGNLFQPEYRDKHRVYCSDVCARRASRRAERLKKRALLKTQALESINPTSVLQRDGWRCQLCGVATPRRLRGTTDPRAPEVDHIIPLARGGEHSVRNLQCACRRCNGEKADRPLGQMRLFG